jgi:hypothetical protein
MNPTIKTGSVPESDLSEHKATPALVAEFCPRATKLSCTRKKVPFRMGEPESSVYLVRSGKVWLTLPI